MDETAVADAAPEAPEAEAPTMLEQGMGRTEILARLMGGNEDREPDDVNSLPDEDGEVAPEAAEAAPAPVEATDIDIPGLEPEKPAEKATDESEKDATAVDDAPGAGKFRVRAEDGKLTAAPNVKFEFQVGDKVYAKDAAGVIRMAIDGIAGQKVAAHAKQLETEVIPRLQYESQQRLTALQADYDAQVALNADILADETGETWAKNHEKFAQSHSPEQVALRAQEDANALRQQLAEQQAQQYTAQVYATQVTPILARVAAECPDVSDHTRAGILADLTKDLLVQGRIPPERYPELVQRLNGPFAQYAKAEQDRFSALTKKQVEATAAAEAKTAAALRDAQKKQNALIAGMKPVGSAPDSPVSKPLPPAKNRREVLERITSGAYVP